MNQSERTTRLEKTVYGNGEIGMDERVREIYQYVQEQKAEKKELQKQRDDDRRFFRRAIITASLAVVVPSLGSFIMLIINGIMFIINMSPDFFKSIVGLP